MVDHCTLRHGILPNERNGERERRRKLYLSPTITPSISRATNLLSLIRTFPIDGQLRISHALQLSVFFQTSPRADLLLAFIQPRLRIRLQYVQRWPKMVDNKRWQSMNIHEGPQTSLPKSLVPNLYPQIYIPQIPRLSPNPPPEPTTTPYRKDIFKPAAPIHARSP